MFAVLAPKAEAAPLAAHRATYDLAMDADSSSDDLLGAEARIAIELTKKDCRNYDLDYRFVARFNQEQEATVTDQQTKSSEALDGSRLAFETKTFVDGSQTSLTKGEAEESDGATAVRFAEPTKRTVTIPLSMFPMAHTQALLAKAKDGAHIFQSPVFDGDDDAEKRLSSTAVIAPADPQDASGPAKEKLGATKAYRVSESFYNSDSDPDGMPIFETAYTLYENGVSDNLVLKFDGYTLTGGLSSLDLLDAPTCAENAPNSR